MGPRTAQARSEVRRLCVCTSGLGFCSAPPAFAACQRRWARRALSGGDRRGSDCLKRQRRRHVTGTPPGRSGQTWTAGRGDRSPHVRLGGLLTRSARTERSVGRRLGSRETARDGVRRRETPRDALVSRPRPASVLPQRLGPGGTGRPGCPPGVRPLRTVQLAAPTPPRGPGPVSDATRPGVALAVGCVARDGLRWPQRLLRDCTGVRRERGRVSTQRVPRRHRAEGSGRQV